MSGLPLSSPPGFGFSSGCLGASGFFGSFGSAGFLGSFGSFGPQRSFSDRPGARLSLLYRAGRRLSRVFLHLHPGGRTEAAWHPHLG
nr:MAG TPA: hypothetical protein [Caudoviricetes sp.]